MKSDSAGRPANRFNEFRLEDTQQTLSGRFEQQAHRYPERLAIKSEHGALSYDELNRAANRVALALLDRAGAVHERVALFCGSGLSTIIAILAILKAGKAFVPLDPRLPKTKIAEIVARVEARFLLTDESAQAAAKTVAAGRSALNIDAFQGNLSSANPGLTLSPEAIAYIGFTSGSTGEPKGVVWNHRSELFGARTKTNALHLAADDRVSLLRANNVGAARDMFLALLNGAALFTLELNESNLASLPKWLRAENITLFSCVATIFRHTLQNLSGPDHFPSVRLVHVGGEPVFKTDVDSYRRCFRDDCLFVNRYSISETPPVCYFFVDKQREITAERVPAGYPLEGNEILLLDDNRKALGAGAVGEIAVRSRHLAVGYWRLPELTRRKFLADPEDSGLRTYLTGDLGYLLPDGCLVHVGRKDFQTKIKGHRVELGAVEAALRQIPRVKQAVVIVGDRANGDRLIAYLVLKKKPAFGSREARAQLKSRLPRYMIPSRFVVLDRLPLSAGGKVDRGVLRALDKNSAERKAATAVGRSALETLLLGWWREALRAECLGVDDDLTELGVDSLQAAHILARVYELFPLRAPPVGLGDPPTVAALSRSILMLEEQPGQSEEIAAEYLRVEKMTDAEVEAALSIDGGPSIDG